MRATAIRACFLSSLVTAASFNTTDSQEAPLSNRNPQNATNITNNPKISTTNSTDITNITTPNFSHITITNITNITITTNTHQTPTNRNDNITKEHVQAERAIDWYVRELRAYINGTHFDARSFQHQVKSMAWGLWDITNFVEKLRGVTKQIERKLRFAKAVFHQMNHATEYLYETHGGDLASDLLYQMMEFNILLFEMHNGCGELDTTKGGYVGRILHYWQHVVTCERGFKVMAGTELDIRFMFDDQALRARRTLQVLGHQVPQSDEWFF